MMIRALLFDYGGTLDGVGSHWLDRFVGLYNEANIDLPFDRIKTAFYRADEAANSDPHIADSSLCELMEFHVRVQLAELGIDDSSLHEHLVTRFVARSEAALEASRAVLAQLVTRFQIGVVSNFYGNVGRILADAQIAPLLSVIVDSHLVGLSKPDVRIFHYALGALGTAPAETLHVGDSYERDVLAAHAAGLRTAWLIGNGRRGAEISECVADIRLQSLEGLFAFLDQGGQPVVP